MISLTVEIKKIKQNIIKPLGATISTIPFPWLISVRQILTQKPTLDEKIENFFRHYRPMFINYTKVQTTNSTTELRTQDRINKSYLFFFFFFNLSIYIPSDQ